VHARVWLNGGGEAMIEDLGSRNGTFLNGSRIHGPRVLHPGDWLRTGHTTMEVVANGVNGDAPRYDALVEERDEGTAPVAVAAHGSSGHIRPWPLAAILAALLAGGGVGAAVAASAGDSAQKTSTMVVTHRVVREAPPPRLAAPSKPVQLPTWSAAASREAFVRAFCARGAAPRGICGCTYLELTRREPYALLHTQVAGSHGRRISPAIVSASRACGAG
jgi:hypothetical protein